MSKKSAHSAIFWAVTVAFLYLAAPILIPLALAALLAALLQGLSEWLEGKGFTRLWSSLSATLALLISFSAFAAILALQLNDVVEQSQGLREQVSGQIDRLKAWISDTFGMSPAEQEEAISKQQEGAQTGEALVTVVTVLASVALDSILTTVYTFLLLFYRDNLKRFILRLVPSTKRDTTEKIIHASSLVARHYVRGLFYMIVCLWIMYGIGFSVLGIEGALFFALLCGVLEIIPFVGNLVGNLVVVMAVLAQGGDGGMVLGVVGIYLFVQLTQTYILEPLVVGHRVNINALFTILGLIAGELLWGIAGLALAIPVLGIIKIICDHVPELKPYGELLDPKRVKSEKS